MNVGDAFYLPDYGGRHLNFVLEVFPDGSALICNFTDYRTHIDKTCIIEIREHSGITKRSVVNFRQAYLCECGMPMDALARQIEENLEPLSAILLAKIRKAALDSPHTSDNIKALLR
jgi:hypothetical protein